MGLWQIDNNESNLGVHVFDAESAHEIAKHIKDDDTKTLEHMASTLNHGIDEKDIVKEEEALKATESLVSRKTVHKTDYLNNIMKETPTWVKLQFIALMDVLSYVDASAFPVLTTMWEEIDSIDFTADNISQLNNIIKTKYIEVFGVNPNMNENSFTEKNINLLISIIQKSFGEQVTGKMTNDLYNKLDDATKVDYQNYLAIAGKTSDVWVLKTNYSASSDFLVNAPVESKNVLWEGLEFMNDIVSIPVEYRNKIGSQIIKAYANRENQEYLFAYDLDSIVQNYDQTPQEQLTKFNNKISEVINLHGNEEDRKLYWNMDLSVFWDDQMKALEKAFVLLKDKEIKSVSSRDLAEILKPEVDVLTGYEVSTYIGNLLWLSEDELVGVSLNNDNSVTWTDYVSGRSVTLSPKENTNSGDYIWDFSKADILAELNKAWWEAMKWEWVIEEKPKVDSDYAWWVWEEATVDLSSGTTGIPVLSSSSNKLSWKGQVSRNGKLVNAKFDWIHTVTYNDQVESNEELSEWLLRAENVTLYIKDELWVKDQIIVGDTSTDWTYKLLMMDKYTQENWFWIPVLTAEANSWTKNADNEIDYQGNFSKTQIKQALKNAGIPFKWDEEFTKQNDVELAKEEVKSASELLKGDKVKGLDISKIFEKHYNMLDSNELAMLMVNEDGSVTWEWMYNRKKMTLKPIPWTNNDEYIWDFRTADIKKALNII